MANRVLDISKLSEWQAAPADTHTVSAKAAIIELAGAFLKEIDKVLGRQTTLLFLTLSSSELSYSKSLIVPFTIKSSSLSLIILKIV